MVNKVITEYMASARRLIIPEVGALIRRNGSDELIFMDMLKGNDGELSRQIAQQLSVQPDQATEMTEAFIINVRHDLRTKGAYCIEGLGELRVGDDGHIRLVAESSAPTAAPQPAAATAEPESAPQPYSRQPHTAANRPVAATPAQSVAATAASKARTGSKESAEKVATSIPEQPKPTEKSKPTDAERAKSDNQEESDRFGSLFGRSATAAADTAVATAAVDTSEPNSPAAPAPKASAADSPRPAQQPAKQPATQRSEQPQQRGRAPQGGQQPQQQRRQLQPQRSQQSRPQQPPRREQQSTKTNRTNEGVYGEQNGTPHPKINIRRPLRRKRFDTVTLLAILAGILAIGVILYGILSSASAGRNNLFENETVEQVEQVDTPTAQSPD